MPTEAGMMCTIDGETYHMFTKNMWSGDSGTLCHITNDDTSLFDITIINKLVQENSGSMIITKKVLNGYILYGP